MTPRVGQYWLFTDEVNISIWKVVSAGFPNQEIAQELALNYDANYHNLCLECIADLDQTDKDLTKPGAIFPYRRETMLDKTITNTRWELIDEEDIPLYILGEV